MPATIGLTFRKACLPVLVSLSQYIRTTAIRSTSFPRNQMSAVWFLKAPYVFIEARIEGILGKHSRKVFLKSTLSRTSCARQ